MWLYIINEYWCGGIINDFRNSYTLYFTFWCDGEVYWSFTGVPKIELHDSYILCVSYISSGMVGIRCSLKLLVYLPYQFQYKNCCSFWKIISIFWALCIFWFMLPIPFKKKRIILLSVSYHRCEHLLKRQRNFRHIDPINYNRFSFYIYERRFEFLIIVKLKQNIDCYIGIWLNTQNTQVFEISYQDISCYIWILLWYSLYFNAISHVVILEYVLIIITRMD